MMRECKQCGIAKKLNVLNFLEGFNQKRMNPKQYFTHVCRRCFNTGEIQKRKDRRNVIKPSKGMHFIRQAVIGYKTEPYFEGENFEYTPPTYEQILMEYENN